MKYILILLVCFFSKTLTAQQAPIAIVSSNGTTKLTSTLDSASILAQDNDIIYLPGGSFAGMTISFTKKVTLIGVGHNPDSTGATSRTFIEGYVGFYNGAEGSTLDGVYVTGTIYVSANCKIYRSNCWDIICPNGFTTAINLLVSQCIMRYGIYGQYGYNNIVNASIKNCIVGSGGNFTQQIYNSIYENCIFLNQGAYGIEGASQCTFRNCTFTGITSWGSPSNSFFYNNIFTSAGNPPLSDSSNAIGNKVNQTGASTFTIAPTSSYSYANDYTIKAGSVGIAAGTDGKDIGIYGGSLPWVKGNIPPNPHIRTKNVDVTTGAGGTLRVRFNVGVQ